MNKTKSTQGSHLETFLYRVPKKNRDAVAQNLKKFVPWFEKHGVGIAYYRLGDSKTMEGFEDIATTISAEGRGHMDGAAIFQGQQSQRRGL